MQINFTMYMYDYDQNAKLNAVCVLNYKDVSHRENKLTA